MNRNRKHKRPHRKQKQRERLNRKIEQLNSIMPLRIRRAPNPVNDAILHGMIVLGIDLLRPVFQKIGKQIAENTESEGSWIPESLEEKSDV